jgi:TRAP-type C4-dicarboxylate transport system permease small subunit
MNFFLRNKLAIFTMVVLLALLAWVIWTMVQMWISIEVDMSPHTVIAMWLGIVFSCLVGFGLMGLMFYSSRKGYDETPTYTQEDSEARDDRNDTR